MTSKKGYRLLTKPFSSSQHKDRCPPVFLKCTRCSVTGCFGFLWPAVESAAGVDAVDDVTVSRPKCATCRRTICVMMVYAFLTFVGVLSIYVNSVDKHTDPAGSSHVKVFTQVSDRRHVMCDEPWTRRTLQCPLFAKYDPHLMAETDQTFENAMDISPLELICLSRKCPLVKDNLMYKNTSPQSSPMAFVLFVDKGVVHFDKVFRMLYHSNNVYCFQVSADVDNIIQMAVEAIVSCFPSNVLVVMERDLTREITKLECAEAILQVGTRWTYQLTIPLRKHLLPLKTTHELGHLLQALDGASFDESETGYIQLLAKDTIPDVKSLDNLHGFSLLSRHYSTRLVNLKADIFAWIRKHGMRVSWADRQMYKDKKHHSGQHRSRNQTSEMRWALNFTNLCEAASLNQTPCPFQTLKTLWKNPELFVTTENQEYKFIVAGCLEYYLTERMGMELL